MNIEDFNNNSNSLTEDDAVLHLVELSALIHRGVALVDAVGQFYRQAAVVWALYSNLREKGNTEAKINHD